jgi:hypothetical protein
MNHVFQPSPDVQHVEKIVRPAVHSAVAHGVACTVVYAVMLRGQHEMPALRQSDETGLGVAVPKMASPAPGEKATESSRTNCW